MGVPRGPKQQNKNPAPDICPSAPAPNQPQSRGGKGVSGRTHEHVPALERVGKLVPLAWRGRERALHCARDARTQVHLLS
eukprot:3592464-Prymnesium_polylepis.1